MKLKGMKRLPRKAGLAKLHFDRKIYIPERINDNILLPEYPRVEFLQLQEGRQFLLRIPSRALDYNSFVSTWFGGTDESPFLVSLRNEAFRSFKKGRQKDFYEALKPKIIRKIERMFNVESKRQGDIWAAPILCSIGVVSLVRCFVFDRLKKPKHRKIRLFSTRHRLTGFYLGPYQDYFSSRYSSFAIGEGVIEAPDHSPMKLEKAHVLAQTRYLVNPKKAD